MDRNSIRVEMKVDKDTSRQKHILPTLIIGIRAEGC